MEEHCIEFAIEADQKCRSEGNADDCAINNYLQQAHPLNPRQEAVSATGCDTIIIL